MRKTLVLMSVLFILSIAATNMATDPGYEVLVTGSAGPIEGASVKLTATSSGGGSFLTSTNWDGLASFASVPDGDYSLCVHFPAKDYPPVCEGVTISPAKRGRHSIIVG